MTDASQRGGVATTLKAVTLLGAAVVVFAAAVLTIERARSYAHASNATVFVVGVTVIMVASATAILVYAWANHRAPWPFKALLWLSGAGAVILNTVGVYTARNGDAWAIVLGVLPPVFVVLSLAALAHTLEQDRS